MGERRTFLLVDGENIDATLGTALFQLYKEMDARDEEPVVVYHSHTATEAYPSRTDIGLAMEPGAHYVLVSTREHGNNEGPVEFRSYRIVDGEVTEEEVTVVDSLPVSPPPTSQGDRDAR